MEKEIPSLLCYIRGIDNLKNVPSDVKIPMGIIPLPMKPSKKPPVPSIKTV